MLFLNSTQIQKFLWVVKSSKNPETKLTFSYLCKSILVFLYYFCIHYRTWSSPRYPLFSHSLVCIDNNLFIVGIGPILNKELEFIFRTDCSDGMSNIW